MNESAHSSRGSRFHNPDILVDPGIDEIIDSADFEDTRLELKSCGHNLVCMNSFTFHFSNSC